MRIWIWACLLFLLLSFSPNGVVKAQEPEEDPLGEEDDEGVEEPTLSHPDVEAVVFFPDNADKRFIIGEPITVLVGFSNKGEGEFNLTSVQAHFHSPYDFSYYIQNFTRKYVSVTAGPHQQVTLEYKFTPDKSLEPLSFWLSAYVDYNGTDGEHRTTFTNGTVELIEKPSDVDTRRLFTALFAVSALALAAYLYLGPSAGSSKTSVEHGTKQSTDDEWGPIYSPKPQPQSRSKKASKASK